MPAVRHEHGRILVRPRGKAGFLVPRQCISSLKHCAATCGRLISGGGDWAEGARNGETLTAGTLEHGETYTVCHPFFSRASECNHTTTAISFSGDDALGLAVGGTLVDSIGTSGSDPGLGWTVRHPELKLKTPAYVFSMSWCADFESRVTQVGSTVRGTKDHVLRRATTMVTGNTNWGSASATEWQVFERTETSDFGLHSTSLVCYFECPVIISGSDGGGGEDGSDADVSAVANPYYKLWFPLPVRTEFMYLGKRRLLPEATGIRSLAVQWELPSSIDEAEFIVDELMSLAVCKELCGNNSQAHSKQLFSSQNNFTNGTASAATNTSNPICIGVEFSKSWASAIWNVTSRSYSLYGTAYDAGPHEPDVAELIAETGTCNVYYVSELPGGNSKCTIDDNLFELDGCSVNTYANSSGAYFLPGAPATGTFQAPPWTYVQGNESLGNQSYENYSIFSSTAQISLVEGEKYAVGWRLESAVNRSANDTFTRDGTFLQVANSSCSPGKANATRLDLFDTSPGHAGSMAGDENHTGIVILTSPATGVFQPRLLPVHDKFVSYTGCTDTRAMNYNEYALSDVNNCIYNCSWAWTPVNLTINYTADRATQSSLLPNPSYGAGRSLMSALDDDPLSTYHSNQGTPSPLNPVLLAYDFDGLLAPDQAVVQYSMETRCCGHPYADEDAPLSWTFEGSDDASAWETLGSVDEAAPWANSTGVSSEVRYYKVDSPARRRFYRLAVTRVKERGAGHGYLVISKLRFIAGSYLCTAEPAMLDYDPDICSDAIIDTPRHADNVCAQPFAFVFTRVRETSGLSSGIALNYYEPAPCYDDNALVCSTSNQLIPLTTSVNCSQNNGSGSADPVTGLAGVDSYSLATDGINASSVCNSSESLILSRFWSTLEYQSWNDAECLVLRASLGLIPVLESEIAAAGECHRHHLPIEIFQSLPIAHSCGFAAAGRDDDALDMAAESSAFELQLWESESGAVLINLTSRPRQVVTVTWEQIQTRNINRTTTCQDDLFAQSAPASCDLKWLGSVKADCEYYFCPNCPFAHTCDLTCQSHGFDWCNATHYGGAPQLHVEPAVIVFSPLNWTTPVLLVITAIGDLEFEDYDYATVMLEPKFSSQDCFYDKQTPEDMRILVSVLENDCINGYYGSVQRGCLDYDECAYENGVCRAECYNTLGSYYCSPCPAGITGDWTRAGVTFFHYEIIYQTPVLEAVVAASDEGSSVYFAVWLSSPPLADENLTVTRERECCDQTHDLAISLLVANETVHIGWETSPNATCDNRFERGMEHEMAFDPTCTYHRDCASCLSARSALAPAVGCGWCADSQQCLDGAAVGAYYPYVCPGNWAYDQCPCAGLGKSLVQFSQPYNLTVCSVDEEMCPSLDLSVFLPPDDPLDPPNPNENECAKGVSQGYACDFLELYAIDCARMRYCGFCQNEFGLEPSPTCMPIDEQNRNTCPQNGYKPDGHNVTATDVPTVVGLFDGYENITVPTEIGTYFLNWYNEVPCEWVEATHLADCNIDLDGFLWTHNYSATQSTTTCVTLRASIVVNVLDVLPLPILRQGLFDVEQFYGLVVNDSSTHALVSSRLYENCTQGDCELLSTVDMGYSSLPTVYNDTNMAVAWSIAVGAHATADAFLQFVQPFDDPTTNRSTLCVTTSGLGQDQFTFLSNYIDSMLADPTTTAAVHGVAEFVTPSTVVDATLSLTWYEFVECVDVPAVVNDTYVEICTPPLWEINNVCEDSNISAWSYTNPDTGLKLDCAGMLAKFVSFEIGDCDTYLPDLDIDGLPTTTLAYQCQATCEVCDVNQLPRCLIVRAGIPINITAAPLPPCSLGLLLEGSNVTAAPCTNETIVAPEPEPEQEPEPEPQPEPEPPHELTVGEAYPWTVSLEEEEYEEHYFQIVLTLPSQPLHDVAVDLVPDVANQVVLFPSSLTFTPEDWDRPHFVTVRGLKDDLYEGDGYASGSPGNGAGASGERCVTGCQDLDSDFVPINQSEYRQIGSIAAAGTLGSGYPRLPFFFPSGGNVVIRLTPQLASFDCYYDNVNGSAGLALTVKEADCPDGFDGNGLIGCSDIDECSLNVTLANAAPGNYMSVGNAGCRSYCQNFAGSFACYACPAAPGSSSSVTGVGLELFSISEGVENTTSHWTLSMNETETRVFELALMSQP